MSIEENGFANNGGITSETFFPKTVAENDHVVMAGLAVFGSKAGPEDGIDAEQGKEIRGDVLDDDLLGLAISSEIVALVEDESHARENGIPSLPIEKVRRRDGVVGIGVLRTALPDHHQVVRIVVRQRVKENGIDDGENRGIRANAKGEGEDGDRGEARTAMKRAECVAKIARGFV